MRGWVKRAACALVLGPLLAVGAALPASAALTDPFPDPLLNVGRSRAPSSVFSALANSSAAQRVAAARGVITGVQDIPTAGRWRIPLSVGKVATKAGAPFLTGVTGFVMGFEGANVIMRALPDSVVRGDTVGIGALFPSSAAGGYSLNSDFVGSPKPPGWNEAPGYLLSRYTTGGNYSTVYTRDNEQTWRVASGGSGSPSAQFGTMTSVLIDLSPIIPTGQTGGNNPYNDTSLSAFGYCMNLSSGAVSAKVSFSNPTASSWTLACPAGWVVDHFQFTAHASTHDTSGALTWEKYYPGPTGSTNYVWYPEGHALWTDGTSTDPLRAWETRWSCTVGSLPAPVRSAGFHESDAEYPSFPVASCAEGVVASMQVWEVAPDGGVPDVMVIDWVAPAGVTEWAAAAPECVRGDCTLELGRVDPNGTVLDCFANPGACVNWWTDTQRETKYRCTYGGKTQPTSECAVYSVTFNVATNTEVPDDDGPIDPSTVDPYGDPATGDPVPGSGSGPGDAPGTGGGGTDPQSCMPPFELSLGGIGYWLVKGIVCAIPALFIPDGQVLGAQLSETMGVVGARPPFTAAATVGPVFTGLGEGWAGGTCSHALADFTPVGLVDGLAIPCQPPAVEGFSVLYSIATGALIVGTGFALWGMLVAALGGKSAE